MRRETVLESDGSPRSKEEEEEAVWGGVVNQSDKGALRALVWCHLSTEGGGGCMRRFHPRHLILGRPSAV